MIILKLQYSNFEEGEFTEEQIIDYSSFLELFNKEDNDKIYSKHSWTLEHDRIKYFLNIENTYFIIIEHIARDGYKVTFSELNDKNIYENGFYNSSIEDILKLFFNTNFEALKKEFKIATTNNLSIINRFNRNFFEYEYNDIVIGQFALTLFVYSIVPCFFIAFANLSTCIIITFILLLAAIFLCWIHFNHIRESKNKSIIISSGNEEVVLTINDYEYKFFKKDIKKLKLITDAGKLSLLTFYNYSQILLNNGSIINITNMIIEPTLMDEKIRFTEKENKVKLFPYIKPKTKIISDK
ncbi:MAG: hypothetical protein HXX18_14090 [Bacteroidetes bacterium]|nr:hypothetical protein [Bacteroidota bacterium]